MAAISEFRNGMAIRFNNDIWIITEFQHVTPGNWRAMVRTKLKNAKTGRVIDNTFRMTDNIEAVRLDEKEMQYLYESDGNLYFMDTETYDQTFIPTEMLGDQT
ncbi:MAG TPA: elongation factor P, partial [bacterium]|nr:elongation factor P [bacterium]